MPRTVVVEPPTVDQPTVLVPTTPPTQPRTVLTRPSIERPTVLVPVITPTFPRIVVPVTPTRTFTPVR
jgi:hypothetical protein